MVLFLFKCGWGARLSPGHAGIRLAAAGSRSQCARTPGAPWHRARLRPPPVALGVTCSPGPAPGPRDGVPNLAGESAASQVGVIYVCLWWGQVLNPPAAPAPPPPPPRAGVGGGGSGGEGGGAGEGRVCEAEAEVRVEGDDDPMPYPKPGTTLPSLSCLSAWAVHACWARSRVWRRFKWKCVSSSADGAWGLMELGLIWKSQTKTKWKKKTFRRSLKYLWLPWWVWNPAVGSRRAASLHCVACWACSKLEASRNKHIKGC